MYDNIIDLMMAWMEKHKQKGYRNFIIDGFVDETAYNKSPLKICFLLEESYITETEEQNDIEDAKKYIETGIVEVPSHHWVKYIMPRESDCYYDLTENLKSEDPWFMWNTVKWISDIIYRYAGLSTDNSLLCTAVVNLKKSDGKNESDLYGDIIDYVREDLDLIHNELKILNPDIIICGKTYDFCKDTMVLSPGEHEHICSFDTKSGLYDAYLWNGIIVISMYHPSAPRLSRDKLETAYSKNAGIINGYLINRYCKNLY